MERNKKLASMNEEIKIWIFKAEQIYNNFTERKNLKIWEELLNEVSVNSPFFFKWRNEFLLYLNSHPFLSSAVYQFINQTFHLSEDYYALISEEERKGEVKEARQYGSIQEKKEFQRIVSVIQEENLYVSKPLFFRSQLFDIDRMDIIAEQADHSAPDDYIYEYLKITGNYRKNSGQADRETTGRFGRMAKYRQSIESYKKNLLALSRYGYTSIYEREQFMWLSCWFGELDKALTIAEEILKKEPDNLYAASYRAYFLARQGTIREKTNEKIYSDITALDREENLCQIMIKTAIAFCEIQNGNFKKVISILSEVLDYSEMPFLNNDAEYYYTPAFWQHGRKLLEHQALVLCGGQTAYKDGCKLLRSAYQLLLQENKFDSTVESVLYMAKAYLYTGAYEQAYHIIYDEQSKQTIIRNKRQTEYFIVMADVLYARGDYEECIKTAENLDRMLSKNKEIFCGRWGKAVYDKAFCHNLYLMANCSFKIKKYENSCFYLECLMEEDFAPVQVYVIYLKACFFLCKLDKVKKTYDRIHFLFNNREIGYYAAQAVLRQKEFWRDIQYEEAAEILWTANRSQPLADYMESTVCTSSKFSDFPRIKLLQNFIKAGLSDLEEEKEQIYEETLSFFQCQKEAGEQDMETALIMAQFAMERNKSRDAYKILKNYQKEQNEQIHEPLFWYDCGVCLEAAGEDEEALRIYRKILQDYGVYKDVCIRISYYYQRRYFLHTFSLEDKNAALQYLKKQEESEDIQPCLELAEYYYQLTEYENAIEAYLKDKEQRPDLYYQRGYELMGNCFLRIYRSEMAEKYFVTAFNWRPEKKSIYFETADVLKERKDYKKAVWWHKRALKKFGEAYDRGYEAIGDLYLLLSERKKALAYYNMQWIFVCDRTDADREEGERLKMRYYKRMMYFYLTEGQEETAFDWAEQGMQELSGAAGRAGLSMFYAETLMCKGAEYALQVMEKCMKRDGEELKKEKNYELLLAMEAQLLSYYFLTGKKEQLAKRAKEFQDIFSTAYPQAELEDWAAVKREGPKRYGEMGWYYLALGKRDFAQQCFQKQWSLAPCIRCRSRYGCYRGYLNIARYCEVVKEYNRAIYFYKELLGEKHLPNHVEAKAALQRLQKMPKAKRGEEFRRW